MSSSLLPPGPINPDSPTNPERERISRRDATKLLTEQNYHLEVLQKRFKVLQLQDQYHKFKTIDQDKKVRHYHQIRTIITKDKNQAQRKMEERLSQMEQLRASIDRQADAERLREARRELEMAKMDQVAAVKGESKLHETLIHQERENSVRRKQMMRQQVVEEQEKIKQRLNEFKRSRIKSIVGSITSQTDTILELTLKNSRQLDRMMKIEQEMLRKQANSRSASRAASEQCQKLFGSKIDRKTNASERLPSLSRNSSPKDSNQSFLVLM